MKLSNKKLSVIISFVLFILIAAVLIFFLLFREKDPVVKELKKGKYDSVFLSTYSVSNYTPEHFNQSAGLNTHIVYTEISDIEQMSKYITAAFSSKNTVSSVFIGINPSIWVNSDYSAVESILNTIDDNADTTFYIFPLSPSVDYWMASGLESATKYTDDLKLMCSALAAKENVNVSFLGADKNVISDKKNYEDDNVSFSSVFVTEAIELGITAQLTANKVEQAASDLLSYIKMYPVLTELEADEYDSFFLSMYPISHYTPDGFEKYMGLNTKLVYTTADDIYELTGYADAAFSSHDEITTVFLGLDAAKFVSSYFEYEYILTTMLDEYPSVTFWIFPATPGIEYWLSLSSTEVSDILDAFSSLCVSLSSRQNVTISYLGSEEWLIANALNYESDNITISESFASNAFFLSLSAQITADNITEKVSGLESIIEKYRNDKPSYSDFSDSYFVYIGDSIIANDLSSSSLPGVISSLNGSYYAIASHGGTPAATVSPDFPSLSLLVDNLVSATPIDAPSMSDFNAGLSQFISDADLVSQKKLYFVINMCLNDYFLGNEIGSSSSDISTYKGALAENIQKLKEAYPDSGIILMAPNPIMDFDCGKRKTSAQGDVLQDYINALSETAVEQDCDFINIYNNFKCDEETLSEYLRGDLVHPSEKGRYFMGIYFAEQLEILYR